MNPRMNFINREPCNSVASLYGDGECGSCRYWMANGACSRRWPERVLHLNGSRVIMDAYEPCPLGGRDGDVRYYKPSLRWLNANPKAKGNLREHVHEVRETMQRIMP